MNETSNGTFVMHDPYVQGTSDPYAAAPAEVIGAAALSNTARNSGNGANMRHGLSEEVIGSPISAEEAYQGSMRGMLGREIGAYIAATFLVGSEELVRWEGRLYEVGNNYIVIYQQEQGRYIVGDINSLRFVEFSETGDSLNCQMHNYSNGPTAW